jgi:hypothetical protein
MQVDEIMKMAVGYFHIVLLAIKCGTKPESNPSDKGYFCEL